MECDWMVGRVGMALRVTLDGVYVTGPLWSGMVGGFRWTVCEGLILCRICFEGTKINPSAL